MSRTRPLPVHNRRGDVHPPQSCHPQAAEEGRSRADCELCLGNYITDDGTAAVRRADDTETVNSSVVTVMVIWASGR
jgi:hypothetical protein